MGLGALCKTVAGKHSVYKFGIGAEDNWCEKKKKKNRLQALIREDFLI